MAAKATDRMRVHIRWMIRCDMAEVLDIETESFEHPWTEDDFIKCLRGRNCIGMVAEHGERVVGFMIYELHKTRLHLLNLAVGVPWRGRGVGSQMVEKLVGKLSRQRRTHIDIHVSDFNLNGHLFLRDNGFKAIKVVPDHYSEPAADAYLFRLRVPHPECVEACPPAPGA